MNTTIDLFLIADKAAREEKRQIELIASYLMQILQIQNSDHLVLFFGTGQEKNNYQALISWVEKHMDDIDSDKAEVRLKHLANKAIQTIQEQVWSD